MALLDLKVFAKRLLAYTGFQISRTSSVEALDLHLIKVFNALAINCVLDVGAHEGDFGRQIRRNGYQGHILSFEPVKRNFERLSHAASRDPRWRVFPFGLGNKNEHVNINIFGFSTFHSLLAPSEFGRKRFGEEFNVERTERVEIKRLDQVLDACLGSISTPRLFLKMDTQGYDLSVIEGAGAALSRVLALQTEVALKPIYQNMRTTLSNMVPELQKRGFGVSGMFPVARDKNDGLQIIEIDCVMTRNATGSAAA